MKDTVIFFLMKISLIISLFVLIIIAYIAYFYKYTYCNSFEIAKLRLFL